MQQTQKTMLSISKVNLHKTASLCYINAQLSKQEILMR